MGIFTNLFRDRRKEQLEQLAPSLRMKFSKKDELGVINLLKDFKLFKQGHSKRISNLLWLDEESVDLKTRVFDYQFTISAGNSHHVHRQTVFFFYSKELGLPTFKLQPEKFIHRIGAFLGREDIDFNTHPEFSKDYHLKGEDEELIRDTFTKPVLNYFTFQKNWCVEGLNYFLIIYRTGKRLRPNDIKMHYKTAMDIYDVLKDEGFRV